MNNRWSDILHLAPIAVAVVLVRLFQAPATIAAFMAIFAILALGYLLGPHWLKGRPTALASIWGSLGAIAALMLVRGAWFYVGLKMDPWADAWTVVITLVLGCLWLTFDQNGEKADDRPKLPKPTPLIERLFPLLTSALSLAALSLIAFAATRAATADSIRTPWPLMPSWTLPLIGMLWVLALATAWRSRSTFYTWLQTACALAATFCIAPLLYKLGYGFDGFLHIAGETVLAKTGFLTPKPPYYMGQYVFVTWIAPLFDLTVSLIDRWLVPVTAALTIPAALALVTSRDRSRVTIFLGLLLLPLGAFIATTPHGFATTLGVIALLLCIPPSDDQTPISPILPLLFATWSALTHPLVGLPILLGVLMAVVWARRKDDRWAPFAAYGLALATGIIVPLVFGLASGAGSSAGVTFDTGNVLNVDAWKTLVISWIPWVRNRYALWPETSVWVDLLIPWLTIIFAALAILRARREKQHVAPWLIAAGSVALAAIVLGMAGDFGFLIDYERGNYAARLWLVARLLLLPLAIPELGRRLNDARQAAFVSAVTVLTTVGLVGAAATYAALPRHDAITPSRGWSVGQADVDAVKLIDEDAAGRPYTVLANQSVSAAAVKTFGFKRYHNDVFFYPIPTGGPLYQLFLRASYEDPSREVMRDAGRLAGSDLVYFVLNDYWWRAEEFMNLSEAAADRTFVVQDGKVKVYKFDLTLPDKAPKSE